jgi:hypothetical protein
LDIASIAVLAASLSALAAIGGLVIAHRRTSDLAEKLGEALIEKATGNPRADSVLASPPPLDEPLVDPSDPTLYN